MSGATLTLRYEDADLQRLAKRLQRALAKADRKPLLHLIAGALRESAILRFHQGKAPDGSHWKKSRRALETGGQTLILEGRLRDSLAAIVGAKRLEVGTNVEYGGIHQFGGVIRPKNRRALNVPGIGPRASVTLPARPYLGISADDEAEIKDITETWLRKLVDL
ncbi:phage virion morphogenesis protein [uncultured Desulfovibrio sp.]|uniref:phage virion morphogenesis protein n=1 Tax=uncultured Desulfovibrio sp. TaxID=167968 RepID=UPI002632B53F|nr:phage virion morphogenesis protein [uncultured Desulfovibrio sp.]